jgi:hypothetical protein
MITIVSLVILLLFCLLLAQANSRLSHRLKAVEDELEARLWMIDEQISELGGAVVVLQMLTDGPRNQGIRTFNHDYDGKPLSSYTPRIIPENFRRSGEMYVGNARTKPPSRPPLVLTHISLARPSI